MQLLTILIADLIALLRNHRFAPIMVAIEDRIRMRDFEVNSHNPGELLHQ